MGHCNWKWDQASSRYSTYEQELLSGVLVLSSPARILNGNKIVWLCDQKAVESFVKGSPPENPRIIRWWTFLNQLKLKVHHLAGAKNELADFISRNNFERKYQLEWEALAEEALQGWTCRLAKR